MSNENNGLLEVIKLVSSFLTPIVVVGLGLLVSRHLKKIEFARTYATTMTAHRLVFFTSVSLDLNKIYCYYMHIGMWKTLSPPDVLKIKTHLDAEFFRAIPYLHADSFKSYLSLMDACFETSGGRNTAAKLKANIAMHSESYVGDWRSEWNRMFVEKDKRVQRIEVHQKYMALLKAFGHEFGCDVGDDLVEFLAFRMKISNASPQDSATPLSDQP